MGKKLKNMTVGWNKFFFWMIILTAFCCILYNILPILAPFIFGAIVAYLLSPIVTKLTEYNLSRTMGTLLVLLPFLGGLLALFLIYLPALQKQFLDLAHEAPQHIQTAQTTLLNSFEVYFPKDIWAQIQSSTTSYAPKAIQFLGQLLKNMFMGSMLIANILSMLVIMPIVAFYTLRDWPKMIHTIYNLFPKKGQPTVHDIFSEMNVKLSGFIRGQLIVSTILAIYYATALSFTGIKFAIIIGLCTGFFSFIPYVGVLSGLFISLLVGAFNFTDWAPFVHIFIVFGIGQILEGFILTPKFVGDSIGLHPLWVIFSIFVGGLLLGFIGLLIAIPVAACLSVLIAFSLKRYKKSTYYAPEKPLKSAKAQEDLPKE